MNIVIWILIGTYFLLALILRIPGNPHKNIILENTLPKDKLDEPKVTALRKAYKNNLLKIAGALSVLTLPLLFVSYDSIVMASFSLLLVVSIGALYGCEIFYIHKMRQLLIEQDWLLQVAPVLVDTKLTVEKNKKLVPVAWLIGSLLIAGAVLIFSFFQFGSSTISWTLLGTFVLLWGVFAAGYYATTRIPVRALTDDQETNRQYNNLTKHTWSFMMVMLSYLFIPTLLIPFVTLVKSAWLSSVLMVGFLLLLLAGSLFTFYLTFRLRKKQDVLLEETTSYRYNGEDQYWKYGMYINPDDSRLMVPDRLGMNLSINLGKRSGKIISVITLVSVLVILIGTTFPLFLFDFGENQLHYTLTDDQVTLNAPLTKASSIPFVEMESVELLEDLPNTRIRINGMATDDYLTGIFKVENKRAVLYVDRSSKPILKITTQDEDYYYTNKDEAETQQLYQALQNDLGKSH